MNKEIRNMKTERNGIRGRRFFLFMAFLLLALPTWAAGGAYPEKPINMVVPWGAGGTGDMSSRLVAEKISEFLGQPIISVYKAGAGGTMGAAFVAKAKPDGYTILAASSSPILLAPILKKYDYGPDDFIPVGVFSKSCNWLAVKADARWKNLREFIEEERKFPGKLKVGSYGKLTPADFAIELINKYEKIKLTHIPYKSTTEALTAVLGGHIDGGMVAAAGGLLEAGQVRLLAIALEERLENMPDVPVFKEFGYPLVPPGGRYWLCFPKGTPKEIVARFSAAQEKALRVYSKEITEGLKRIEMWPEFLNYEDTVKLLKRNSETFHKIAEELGVLAK